MKWQAWLVIATLCIGVSLAHNRIGKLEKHQVELFGVLNRQADSLLTNAQHIHWLMERYRGDTARTNYGFQLSTNLNGLLTNTFRLAPPDWFWREGRKRI